ncbi:S-protein homolog 2-like [Salvia hispanica]|uniref:S-protein homolog 2-like n=1 Tax=Salvia hispanica TaxID=49212 RepID=UPI0020090102|nr:S-protein homolog 2-like [Salvia hispanica]
MMMKSSEAKALLLSVAIVFVLIASCDAVYKKTTVGIVNQATGNPITVHCYSGDDDLGFKKLAFGESFAWSFRYSVLGNTRYICTINTDFGSGSYVAYKEGFIVDTCGLNCVWIVKQDGPCLQQTRGPLLCQKWQR